MSMDEKLKELSKLKLNWDGCGSKPPGKDVLVLTKEFLDQLVNPPTDVIAMSAGVRVEFEEGFVTIAKIEDGFVISNQAHSVVMGDKDFVWPLLAYFVPKED